MVAARSERRSLAARVPGPTGIVSRLGAELNFQLDGPPTLVAALVPGLTSLAAWWLLGERLGAAGIAGIVLASLGMAIGVLRTTRLARPAGPAATR